MKVMVALFLVICIAHLVITSLLIQGAREVGAKKVDLQIDLTFCRKTLASSGHGSF